MNKIHLFKKIQSIKGIDLKQCILCKKRVLRLNNNKPPEVYEYAYRWVNHEV